MASPQLEDGYTRIANELVDALAGIRLAGQECQVVWSVIRLTYGFAKKCDRISHGTISKATGIPRAKVVVLVKGLVLKKVLCSTNNGTRCPSTIGINKDYSEWLPSPKKGTIPHIGTTPSPNNGTKPSPNNGTLQRKKERVKKETPTPLVIPEWLDSETWDQFKVMRKAIKKVLTPHAEKLAIKRLEDFRSRGMDPNEVVNRSIINSWQGLFELDGSKRNSGFQKVKPQYNERPRVDLLND